MTTTSQPSNLKLRILSALLLAPLVLTLVYLGGYWFAGLILVAAVLMSFEWNHIISGAVYRGRSWDVLGVLYVVIPCLSLIFLRAQPNGLVLIGWLLAVVWATDIAAYFTGRAIGGPKLAPWISPKKTWSGLGGGVLAAAAAGAVTASLQSIDMLQLAWISAILAVIAQIGDLLESAIKRHFNVKDSGSIIPGHGGILDRVDGLILTAPLVVFLHLAWGILP